MGGYYRNQGTPILVMDSSDRRTMSMLTATMNWKNATMGSNGFFFLQKECPNWLLQNSRNVHGKCVSALSLILMTKLYLDITKVTLVQHDKVLNCGTRDQRLL